MPFTLRPQRLPCKARIHLNAFCIYQSPTVRKRSGRTREFSSVMAERFSQIRRDTSNQHVFLGRSFWIEKNVKGWRHLQKPAQPVSQACLSERKERKGKATRVTHVHLPPTELHRLYHVEKLSLYASMISEGSVKTGACWKRALAMLKTGQRAWRRSWRLRCSGSLWV